MSDLRSGLDPKDYRFINPNPDPDFSPERNQAIIEETMRETDKFLNDWQHIINEDGMNRLDILKSFAMYKIGKGGGKSIEQYLGRKQYESLLGEKILSKVRVMATTNRLNGNSRFKKGILL